MLEISEEDRKYYLKKIEELTLLDDEFMYLVFTSSPECTEYVLETILDKKLHVVQNITQHTLKGHYGNEVRLDISAVDDGNNFYDIEIQRANRGAHPKRARYNSALMDSNYKNPGLHGRNLPETYVIFITEKDYWKQGLSKYEFDRTCRLDSGLKFEDQLHIVYVNGESRKEDRIAELMQDFRQKNSKSMRESVLRNRVAYLKETREGKESMCQIWQDIENRGMQKGEQIGMQKGEQIGMQKGAVLANMETAKKMLAHNLSMEDVKNFCSLSDEALQEIIASMNDSADK